jgi:hypothetical protein
VVRTETPKYTEVVTLTAFLALSLSLRIDRALKFHYVGNTGKFLRQLAPPRISSKTESVRAANWLRKLLRPAGLLKSAPKDVTIEFSSHYFLGRRPGKNLNCVHFFKCFNPYSKKQHCDIHINK